MFKKVTYTISILIALYFPYFIGTGPKGPGGMFGVILMVGFYSGLSILLLILTILFLIIKKKKWANELGLLLAFNVLAAIFSWTGAIFISSL